MRLKLALFALLAAMSPAAADVAIPDDISVHFFMTETGALSPDLYGLKNPVVFNLSVGADGYQGGKFNGYLVKVRLKAKGEVFAEGKQATLVLRDRKKKRDVETRVISDIYVGSNGIAYYPALMLKRDCGEFDLIVTGNGKRIHKPLQLACGE
jgi:hypothetical protein